LFEKLSNLQPYCEILRANPENTDQVGQNTNRFPPTFSLNMDNKQLF